MTKVRQLPTSITLPNGDIIINPSEEQCNAAGIYLYTPEELQQLEQQELQRQQEAQQTEQQRYMEILGLRDAYVAVVHAMCDLAGVTRVNKIEDDTGVEALQAQVAPEDQGAFMALALKLLYITVDLRRADGDDAWERIPTEVP